MSDGSPISKKAVCHAMWESDVQIESLIRKVAVCCAKWQSDAKKLKAAPAAAQDKSVLIVLLVTSRGQRRQKRFLLWIPVNP